MTTPLISVVVPFYNNVAVLGECLASIGAQTYGNLQVIMVDDGSTDGSADVAAARAASDSRFTLIRIPNGGPGAARNSGVAAATGEYLAFVDSDDVLPPQAYATLLAVLQETGSDFVSGGVLRLSAAGLGESGLHDRAIKARRLRTHIGRTPELFYDISVWNKLFRRSFWDAAELRLPEGMLWEDLVAMTEAHVLATSVDVITEPIYHWRDRDTGAPSITQSRTDIGNLRDRITALTMIDDFLRDRGTPAMLRQHQHKALLNDLWLYIRDLAATGPQYQREFTELTAGYLRQVDERIVASLPSEHKLAYYLIGQEQPAELAEFAEWLAAHPGRTPPMVRSAGRLRADLPFRRDRRLSIPARVFSPQWRELDPQVGVDKIGWQGQSLVIEGWAYVPSVDIGSRRHASKLVVLVPRSGKRPPLVLPARSVPRPDVTASSGQNRYSYDWSGFRCVISPRWFRAGRHWLTGDWDCFVLVRGRAVWRPARLHTPGPQAASPEATGLGQGVMFGAHWAGRRLQVRLRRESNGGRGADAAGGGADAAGGGTAQEAARVVQSWEGDQLVLSGRLPPAGQYLVRLRHLDGWQRHEFGLRGAPGSGSVSARIPVGAVDVFGERYPLRDGRWHVSVGQIRREDGAASPLDCAMSAQRGSVRIDRKMFGCRPEPGAAGLVLTVGPALGVAERGRIRRRLLRDIYYRAQRLLPVRDDILFMSFTGKSCTDNPRGIADELAVRGDRRSQVWAVSDWSVPVPPGARAVLLGSAAYFAALGRSAFLIVNDHMPQPYRKRSGQRYVQTWHGTPLKRIGLDIRNPRSAAGRRYFDFLAGDVAQWDLLLSPNPFSTPIMRRAFGFGGDIAETGYPRNDALLAEAVGSGAGSGAPSGGTGRTAAIRRRLGVPDGKRVAMYVPTWRDDQHDAAGRYELEFRLDVAAAARRLADDFVLLVRSHHLMATGISMAAVPGFAFDVTGYPDINDLLMVTDVLITDYSSVTFDFAPTGRPMLFFTYDLEQYRDQLRGFYFDFEADAPGPLLGTSDEVIAALADIDEVTARFRAAHDAFTARFCPLDDGKASLRACDRIFGR